MKISKKRKFAFALCGLGAAFGLILGANFLQLSPKNVSALEVATETKISQRYAYGTRFDVPSGEIVVGDTTIAASEVYVKFPDGSLRDCDSCVLSKLGEYTVVYVAEYQGETLRAEKKFRVNEPTYNSASIAYVEDLKTTETINDAGIKITLKEGETFQCNDVVDISDYGMSKEIVRVYPYSRSLLAENIPIQSMYTIVRLTDYHDPENYVELSMGYYVSNEAEGTRHQYVVAGANGQEKSGLERNEGPSSRKTVYIDNLQYTCFYGTNDFGHCMEWRPNRMVDGVHVDNFDNTGMAVCFDTASNRIYLKQQSVHFISDLDDAYIYGKNTFKGFTTGEIIVSVYADGYETEKAEYEIDLLGNRLGKELGNLEIIDKTPPEITLDKDVNNFYIAKNEPFELFGASAKDKNLVGGVETYVYYEYESSYATIVPIKNGTFTPTRNGNYTIFYKARDTFGNVATKRLDCICVAMQGNSLVAFNTEPLLEVSAGEQVVLNEYTLSGKNGGLYLNVYAVFAGDTSSKIEIDLQNREFLPRNVGEYEIVYEYGDEVRDYTYSYKLTAKKSDNLYMEKPYLPKYLLAKAEYTFENVYVETYNQDEIVLVQPDVFVNEDGKGYSPTPINYKSYTVNAKETVQFKYAYNGVDVRESEQLTVCDVGLGKKIKAEEYFVGAFSKTADYDSVNLVAESTKGNATAEFINAISFSAFEFNFMVPKKSASFNAVNIILTDCFDEQNRVVIRYERSGSGIAFTVNGKGRMASTSSFDAVAHQLWYDVQKKSFVDSNNNVFEMENPFRTDKIYLSVELEGLYGKGGIDVLKICGQLLNFDGYDWVNAMISVPNEISGTVKYGQTLLFNSAQITDVFTPYALSGYSFDVVAPDGTYVTSEEGVLLDGKNSGDGAHTVKFTQYGVYIATYSYTDQSGNPVFYSLVLYVSDRVAPSIVLENGYNETTCVTVKKGASVTVAKYSVDDNLGSDGVEVLVRAVKPNSEIVKVQGDKFTATEKGNWMVVYYVSDKEGNYTITYYTVVVE